jgi:hypothetical protein
MRIPDGVERIGARAFSHAGLEWVALPPSLRMVDGAAFADTKLREIDIPDGVETIGGSAFYQAKLERVALPASLRIIGWLAFAGTKLREIDLPDSVIQVGERAFDCRLTKVSLGPVGGRQWGECCFGTARAVKVQFRGQRSRFMIPQALMNVAVEICYEQGREVDAGLSPSLTFDQKTRTLTVGE